jgi:hypothetical protein
VINAVFEGGRWRTAEGEVPFEEVGVGCWGGGVVWRRGGGDFGGFADCAFVSWLVIASGLGGDVRIRFMVGDLALNFGVEDILRHYEDPRCWEGNRIRRREGGYFAVELFSTTCFSRDLDSK